MTVTESAFEGLHDPEALPKLTDTNRPYFAAAARGELVFQRCARGHAFLYPRLVCPVCLHATLTWETAAGTGEIVSYAPVFRRPWDSFPRTDPYMIVLVRLAEGPHLVSSLEGVEVNATHAVAIGARVRAAFERVSDEIGLVRFVPDAQR
jgi:uncharacterized OB-fold protein